MLQRPPAWAIHLRKFSEGGAFSVWLAARQRYLDLDFGRLVIKGAVRSKKKVKAG
jgi:hypothetical protein